MRSIAFRIPTSRLFYSNALRGFEHSSDVLFPSKTAPMTVHVFLGVIVAPRDSATNGRDQTLARFSGR